MSQNPSRNTAEGRTDHDPVVVLATGDPGRLALAKSILMQAGIRFSTRNEAVQDLFGAGRIAGFDPVVGPVRVLVPEESADDARKALGGLLEESATTRPYSYPETGKGR